MITNSPVLTVSQLNRQVRSWLEHEMGLISVEGELSNLSKPASGHFYFTLKDASAQLRCVYFLNRHQSTDKSSLQNGQQILVHGHLSLYEARGDYQLIVENVVLAGLGDLYHQFELLKVKCAAAGLFDVTRKRQLPKFPKSIGVVTSASAAAWRDIMVTLGRRYPLANIILYASDVQGKLAAPQLRNAIIRANYENRCDVIILARGGGSLEDLWAFNDEALAYAIRDSVIPIVSGIGHETDFTIADFVADHRAATPTAAAEAVTPDQEEILLWLNHTKNRLTTCMRRLIAQKTLLLQHYKKQLTSPERLIINQTQTLDYLEHRLRNSAIKRITKNTHDLHILRARLNAQHPKRLITDTLLIVKQLQTNLISVMRVYLTQAKQKFAQQAATLNAVSPLATLDRGYSLVMQAGHVILNSQDVDFKKPLNIRFSLGELSINCVQSTTSKQE